MKTGGLTAGTAYTTSKGALGAFTFSLARELAADGSHRQRHRPGLHEDQDDHRAADRSSSGKTCCAASRWGDSASRKRSLTSWSS